METKSNLKKIADLLQEPGFDRVLVACHRSPDGDACGSALALAWALRKMGKKTAVFCPDPFGREFSYLTDYENVSLDFVPDHFITVDIADPEMLAAADFTDKIDICIDHHRVNSVKAGEKWVEETSSSCGELVLSLLQEMNFQPDRKIALALYTAIVTDTGLCRYSNTNENTFLSLAYLSRFVDKGDFYAINKLLFETKSLSRLQLESYGVEKVSLFAEGKLAFLKMSRWDQKSLGADYESLHVLINVIRQIEGVLVAMVAKEKEEGVWKVSVRSEAGFDASAFCAQFGGGGHIAAAGCTLKGTEQEVANALVQAAERSLS